MVATTGGGRCEFCWWPDDYRPRIGEGFHNAGCPVSSEAVPSWMDVWRRGHSRGFACDDGWNRIEWWQYSYFSATFLLGYRVGKAEIDRLADEAAERNYSYHSREY